MGASICNAHAPTPLLSVSVVTLSRASHSRLWDPLTVVLWVSALEYELKVLRNQLKHLQCCVIAVQRKFGGEHSLCEHRHIGEENLDASTVLFHGRFFEERGPGHHYVQQPEFFILKFSLVLPDAECGLFPFSLVRKTSLDKLGN